VLDHAADKALVGDPLDNPGTSVTNAIEQVAFDLARATSIDTMRGQLYEYVPWDPERRREWIALVGFAADAWSMPIWNEASGEDAFVDEALAEVRAIRPYQLTNMSGLRVLNRVTRIRIEVPGGYHFDEMLGRLGSVQHISQRRFYYVDVAANSPDDALSAARQALAPHIDADNVQLTTPGAPLDQPGTLPI
jgi:hypothetical protein